MAQQQVFGIAALSCYTVDSSDESDGDQDQAEEKRVEDFGALCIKQEPKEADDEMNPGWEVDKEGQRDPTENITITSEFLQPQDIKVEIESEDESSSSSSSSDSDSDSENDVPDPSIKVKEEDADKPENTGPLKTANELLTKDLPPIEEITNTVPANECKEVGHIKNLVEDLVVVESILGIPALDLETVLFVNVGQLALGRVFDVIGPVTQPLYVVRFNSKQHIADKGITVGMKVYFAPKSDLTSYVFLEQLMAMKISDASWVNDEEPPPQFLDYSDDEQEREAKKELKMKKKENAIGKQDEATQPKRPREMKRNNDQNGVKNEKNLRHCNNRYTPESNPFYRTSRSYNAQQQPGGIQWSQYNVPQQYNPIQPQFNRPPPSHQYHPQHPPPTQGTSYYHDFHQSVTAAAAAVDMTAWQRQYNQNPYQQLASNISYSQQHHNPQPQQSLNMLKNLDQPPPPPPGDD